MSGELLVEQVGDVWSYVSGSFYRAVDPAYQDAALRGSRLAGRYSEPKQRALYLSSSPEGVDAAMIAHVQGRVDELVLLKFHVKAHHIVDLRDPAVLLVAGVNLADAVAPWQDVVKNGGEPASWKVRRRLEGLGATGLIDPSRKSPGRWHLTLFRWNSADAPRVTLD